MVRAVEPFGAGLSGRGLLSQPRRAHGAHPLASTGFRRRLGHLPGRGRQVSDGAGGYWIEDIDEPVPGNAYVLRPGRAPVNHRIVAGDAEIALSARAAGARVRIALQPGEPE